MCLEPDRIHFPNKECLKLRGGARLKFFDTDEDEIVKVLSLFRSIRVFEKFKEHMKCKLASKHTKSSLCSFCLMRSLVIKSKISKGRQVIKPVEILCNISVETIALPTFKIVDTLFENISNSFAQFNEVVATRMVCSDCNMALNLTDNYCITLDQEGKEMNKIENLLNMKTN